MGQFLSSYSIVLKTPEKRPLTELIAEVKTKTTQIKSGSRMVRSHYNFATALWFWNFNKSAKSRAVMFHRYSPIAAGISNINVNHSQFSKNSDVLEYWRVSPTGPLAPLVFSITSFAQQMKICLAYRTSAINEETALAINQSFCKNLAMIVE